MNTRSKTKEQNISEIDELRQMIDDFQNQDSSYKKLNDQLQAEITERKRAKEKLQESEERYRVFANRNPYGIQEIDQFGTIIYANKAHHEIYGYEEGKLIGRSVTDFLALDSQRDELRDYLAILAKEQPEPTLYNQKILTTQGQERDIEVAWNYLRDTEGDVTGFLSILTDITDRKRVEDDLLFSLKFMKKANQHTRKVPLLKELVKELQEYTGCQAIGVRLLDESGNIPYEAYTGFSKEFYELESPLSIENDKCMCINVITRQTDAKLPFYSKGGSFYMNGTTRFLATVSQEDKGPSRNACNKFGYESVALIPIYLKDDLIGLVHLADPRENMVPLHLVETLEQITAQISLAIQRVNAEEILHIERDNLKNIFKTMEDGVYIVNQQYDIEYVNPALKKEFGVYEGRKCYEYFHDRTEICLWCKSPDVFAGKTVRWEWYSEKTGKTYDLIDTPLKNPDGSISKLEIFRDITERKQAEEKIKSSLKEKELLLKEIHHRTKNNFQVISSLLYLQSEYFDDKKVFDVLEKSQNRIKSMAAVHEQLYKSEDFTNIDFAEYAHDLLASLRRSSEMSERSISFKINIDQVFLGLDQAVPCGLIINELFSNSLEHAFPELNKGDNPNAQICIDMHKTDDHELVLVVSDNGTGFKGDIDSMKGKSLGLFLVKNLTEQLEGTVELDTENGTKFTIKFPSRAF